MGKLMGFLQIIRPLNCIMMGFAVVVGASLVSSLSFSSNLLLGFVTAFALTAASMVMNDFCDRQIDAINEPNRPIPRGDVSPKEALFFAVALSLLGIVAVVIVLIGGFRIMTAGGNEEKVTEGRKWLFSGIIGIAIVLSAWAIARFILGSLSEATNSGYVSGF